MEGDCGYGALGSSWDVLRSVRQQEQLWEVLPVCEIPQRRAGDAAGLPCCPEVFGHDLLEPGILQSTSALRGCGVITPWEGAWVSSTRGRGMAPPALNVKHPEVAPGPELPAESRRGADISLWAWRSQVDEPFCVGPPGSYQLPSWEQPRLPSYESVRKKDRQREIHQMIAKRFGLWAEPSQEVSPRVFSAGRAPGAVPAPLCLLFQQLAVAVDSVLCTCLSPIAFISGRGTRCTRRLLLCASVPVNDSSPSVHLQKCLCWE